MQNTSMQTIASLPECILLDGGLGHEWKRQSGDESFLGGCLACTRQPEGVSAVHAAFLEYYGLTSRDVPLLSYTGQGFVDISP